MLPEKDAKRGLKKLVEAGMKKLNVAGGEPFLFPEFLGNICRYVKEDLHLESVSIVTNGSKVTEKWLQKYGKFVDIIAVSCDSLNEQTNIEIERGSGDKRAATSPDRQVVSAARHQVQYEHGCLQTQLAGGYVRHY